MAPNPVMNKPLQIVSLKRIFTGLNPGVGVDLIDWIAHVEEALTFPENRLELSIAYPQYTWFADETEMKSVKREALQETEELLDYMLSALSEEMRPDYKAIFDDYLSRVRYSIERGISSAKDKKTIVALRKQLEESQREATQKGKPKATREEIEKHVKIPPEPRPLTWTTKLERKLEDIFKATFTREGLNPAKFMSEYRVELHTNIKTLPAEDDMVAAVEALAAEIVHRELGRKIKPPRIGEERPPERPPREARVGLPEEEEEEGLYVEALPAEFPTLPERGFFPSRRLTATEIEDIEDAFNYKIAECGKKPWRYTKEFDDWIREELFGNWNHVKRNFTTLVEMICTGKTFEKPPRALPYETTEPLIQWQVSLKIEKPEDWMIPWKLKPPKHNTVEEVIVEMEKLGQPGIQRYEVVTAVKKGWREKIPSFINIDKEYLEKLIGEKIE